MVHLGEGTQPSAPTTGEEADSAPPQVSLEKRVLVRMARGGAALLRELCRVLN